jgi:hypothetical protein
MKKSMLALAPFIALANLGDAHSQQFDVASACGAAISRFPWTDRYDLLQVAEQFEVYKARVCSLNRDNFQSFSNSATSIGLDIPIAKGIIGLDVPHEQNAGEFQSRLNLFCSSQYATYDRKDIFKVSTATVSHDLADTLKFCIQNQRDALLNIRVPL